MSTTKMFDKDYLLEEVMDGPLEVSVEQVGTSRWANEYVMVFKDGEQFFSCSYRHGSGDEGERPFEYVEGEIECVEVFPHQKTITVYKTSKP